MDVVIDRTSCTGHARCNACAPDVFLLDDEGYILDTGTIEVAPDAEQRARIGVMSCPENALSIREPEPPHPSAAKAGNHGAD